MSSYQLLWQNSRSTSDTALSLCAMRLGMIPSAANTFPYAAFKSGADDAMVAAVQLCSERHFLDRLDGLCRPAPSQKLQRFRFERVRRFEEFLQLLYRPRWQPPDVLQIALEGRTIGTTNTRSFRSFLPFDDCRTSSTPMGLHVRTRPGYVAAS